MKSKIGKKSPQATEPGQSATETKATLTLSPVAANPATTGPEPKTLEECAEQATLNHKLALESAASSMEFARKAIHYAIACGAALSAAKEQVKHGEWLPWLEHNAPQISVETARRYIRLEKESRVTDLSQCPTLRQAYLCCRILNEPPAKQEPESLPKSNIPADATVSLTAPAATDETSRTISISVGSEFQRELRVVGNEIDLPVVGLEANKLYRALQPVNAWLREYEKENSMAIESEPERGETA